MKSEDLEKRVKIMDLSLDPNTNNVSFVSVIVHFLVLYAFDAAFIQGEKLFGVSIRGFFCGDDTIRYEYKQDTVTYKQLVVYNLLLNAITVLVVESYRMYKIRTNKINIKYRWNLFVVRILTYFWYSQLGYVINVEVNAVTKNSIGRLRPHFLDVCKLANDTCLTGDFHRHITDYECTGSPELVLEARKSFYSGHSSRSLYSAVWSILYIQARLSPKLNNRVLVPLIQTTMLSIGLFISFSRISDNMHHWSDVLVGILMGSFIATFTCVYWAKLFKKNEEEDDETNGSPLALSSPRESEKTVTTIA